MPVYQLNEEIAFPDPEDANADGLLAVGGDLSSDRLLVAYSLGIFPWFDEHSPILWWSPNPRLILEPHKLKVSKSFRRVLRQKKYRVVFDHHFDEVIHECAHTSRKHEEGTWITNEMEDAYIDLFHQGIAHSVEVYDDIELVGGLYGLSLGKAFFGESMFFKKRDASKVALYYLCSELKKWGFHFIDAQVETDHLLSLGAEKISRTDFLRRLDGALASPTCKGKWIKNIQYEF